jgi:hypothetical protein
MNPMRMGGLGLSPKTGYSTIINVVLEGVPKRGADADTQLDWRDSHGRGGAPIRITTRAWYNRLVGAEARAGDLRSIAGDAVPAG